MPEAGIPIATPAEGEATRLQPAPAPDDDPAAHALCLFAALVSAPAPPALWRALSARAAGLFGDVRADLYVASGDGGVVADVFPGALSGPGAAAGGQLARRAMAAARLVRGGGGRVMAVPVVAGGTPVAAIELAARNGAPFDAAEAHRLAALGVAAGIALQTVERSADIVILKSYIDAVVQATSNAIIGIDAQGRIAGCNPAALRMLRRRAGDVLGKSAGRIFRSDNAWVVERARRVMATGLADVAMEAKLRLARRDLDVNASILPIADHRAAATSAVVVLDDVTAEKQAREVLSRYLDPRVAERLLPGGTCLGSRPVRATLLFCDLRNSTSLAERLGAQQTLALLNEHFALMEGCLRGEGGMIDKFIGDALLATFGIPHAGPSDEDRAVRAAIAMTAALRRWNEARAASGLVPIEMGIGINTDVVVAGNVGAPTRMDYTVVGAGVNVAARLEKACKLWRTEILATANTVRRLKGRYAIRPADPLVIPGRETPVEVFEILGYLDGPPAPNLPRLLMLFRRAVASKRQGRLAEAMAGFSECLSLHPEDRGAMAQLDACRTEMARRGT